MINKQKSIDFCKYIVETYNNKDRRIDFLIGDDFIKFFFYFNSQKTFCNAHILDELNSGLKAYDLSLMSEFYMNLNAVRHDQHDMCWTFFSYNLLGNYYVERYF